jgi:hypothetical protein
MLNPRVLYNVHIHHKSPTIYYFDVSEHFSDPRIFHKENLKVGVTSERRKKDLFIYALR